MAVLWGVGSIVLCLAGTSGSSDFKLSRSSSPRQQFRNDKKPPDFCFFCVREMSFWGKGGTGSLDSSPLVVFRADLLLLRLPCRLRVIRLRFEPRLGLGGSSEVSVPCTGAEEGGCCEVEREGIFRLFWSVFSEPSAVELVPAIVRVSTWHDKGWE